MTDVPARAELLRRVEDLAPVVREHLAWSQEHRRPHREVIQALADAGVFRMRTPLRYGGYESDTRTLVEVGAALGRIDGSTAWLASVYWIPTWMAGLFPDEVQDDVFATSDVRVCGTLSPGGLAMPADGGVVVNGRWGFITGAPSSHWQVIIAIGGTPEAPEPLMALVPMSDLAIVDDWHTAGLRGTESVTTVAENVFVPAARVMPLGAVLQGRSASRAGADTAMYRAPLLPVASASSVGTALGLARAAQDAFMERLPDRKITYTAYAKQAEAPLTHMRVAEAALAADEAEFHAYRLAALVDAKAADSAEWTMAERARARADLGAVCRLARNAVDVLATASGGSSIYRHVPIQRIQRDVHAVNLHALMHPDTNLELYGRVLCGLEPNTLYI